MDRGCKWKKTGRAQDEREDRRKERERGKEEKEGKEEKDGNELTLAPKYLTSKP